MSKCKKYSKINSYINNYDKINTSHLLFEGLESLYFIETKEVNKAKNVLSSISRGESFLIKI